MQVNYEIESLTIYDKDHQENRGDNDLKICPKDIGLDMHQMGHKSRTPVRP
jgi:hypothetical protein